VIHRDVKPSNCFLSADGHVKVGDFGLAKSLNPGAQVTKTGTFLGTPQYAAPEQIKSQPVDPRTDVYSLAATLYYLLAGHAPFEGTDPMAVMARIVSEPAPLLRGKRPDVPPGLDRVLLRGLERDPERRLQSLEDFRVALLPFSPQWSSAGTPGWRVAAHLIDGVLFLLLLIGFGVGAYAVLQGWAGGMGEEEAQLLLGIGGNGLWILYFALLEGIWGWSPGKLLLGLRVCTPGASDPPGLVRALVRSVVFFAIVALPSIVVEKIAEARPGWWWWWSVWLVVYLFAPLLLLSTMRRRNGYRGPHELMSGTRVIMLPRPESESLTAQALTAQAVRGGARPAEAPERIGPFRVDGALAWSPRQRMLTAQDPSLGRRVFIGLHPLSDPGLPAARRDLHRPGRLRWLGGGVQGQWQWDAFLSPDGVPAGTLVAERGPLWWHQARPLLEQLSQELAAAGADGTLPLMLTPEQVWIRPGGSTLLLDAPPADHPEAVPEAQPAGEQERALALLRQIAVLLLDRGGCAPPSPPGLAKRLGLWALTLSLLGGAAVAFLNEWAGPGALLLIIGAAAAIWLAMVLRAKAAHARKGLIRAPLPGHADVLLARLLGVGRPYTTLDEVRADLDATRDRPARVTPKLRLAHLATLGNLLAPGLMLMLLAALLCNGLTIPVLREKITAAEKALHVLDGGRFREFVHGDMGRDRVRKVATIEPPGFEELGRDAIVRRFSEPAVRRVLHGALEQQKLDVERRLDGVNFLEQWLLSDELKKGRLLLEPHREVSAAGFEVGEFLDAVHDAELQAAYPETFRVHAIRHQRGPGLVFFVLVFVLLWPACWVLWAFLWRGGLAQRALGLSLVMANGHRALRLQCAWRALVVWAPVGALVGLSVWLRGYYPEQARWAWASWGAALAVLFGFSAVALRSPTRGLHDRLAGTYLVPR
jgi:hypothetical protein